MDNNNLKYYSIAFVFFALLFSKSNAAEVWKSAFYDNATMYVSEERQSNPIPQQNHRDTSKLRNSKTGYLSPINPFVTHNNNFGLQHGNNDPTKKNEKNTLKEIANRYFVTRNLFTILMTGEEAAKNRIGTYSKSYFETYSGKKIASIRFKQIDPFGPTLQDTALLPTNWIGETGNLIHMNTTKRKLRMNLLFKEGDTVNPIQMAENEKIIRDLPSIDDIAIYLTISKTSPDEVDVVVITKDRFEYGFEADVGTKSTDFQLFNQNMFGIGHRLKLGVVTNGKIEPKVGTYATYIANNIGGRFINTSTSYHNTYLKKSWDFSIEKQFISSSMKNAGGISVEKAYRTKFISNNHPIELDTTIGYFLGDFWMGFVASRKNTIYDTKSIISWRYLYQDYKGLQLQPENKFLRNHNFFLASYSISKRNLFRDNLVYSFGRTEDIPYGKLFELKAGIDKSQFGNWPYFGISMSSARILRDKSYINWQFALDGFLADSKVTQGTLLLKTKYISKLFEINRDSYRQFINVEFIGGINRFKEEYININNKFGIRDFYANEVEGSKRLKISLEMVRFLKWDYHGFRFASFLFSDFAFLSKEIKKLFGSDFYWGIGTGFRIQNESLVFKALEVRFTWFPNVPSNNQHFNLNAFGRPMVQFDDFLGRKPDLIRFQ